jgi:hypothetical protein
MVAQGELCTTSHDPHTICPKGLRIECTTLTRGSGSTYRRFAIAKWLNVLTCDSSQTNFTTCTLSPMV